jgi:hypothetical protein
MPRLVGLGYDMHKTAYPRVKLDGADHVLEKVVLKPARAGG